MAEAQKRLVRQHEAVYPNLPSCTAQIEHSETFRKLARGLGKKSAAIPPLAIAAVAAGTSYAMGSDLHHIVKLSAGSKISYEIACVGAVMLGLKIMGIAQAYDNKLDRKGIMPEVISMLMNTGSGALVLFGTVSALIIPFQ